MLQRRGKAWERMHECRVLLWMAAIFLVVHGLYFRAGVRFQTDPLQDYWQYLDQELLRTRLGESLFYLHTQPPLFNLFLGLVLKSTDFPLTVLHGLYLGMGLALYLCLYALMRELRVSRGVAVATATLFLVSPSFVLYEHWLYYSFPVALALVVSALCLSRLLRTGSTGAIAGFVTSLLMLCGTWSLFHLLYFVLAVALAARLRRGSSRRIIAAAALPFLLVLSVYVKNQVVFGQFTASTWMGMNFWAFTGDQVSLEVRWQMVSDGRLSPVSVVPRFSELKHYPTAYQQCPGYEAVPALATPYKKSGRTNYNHHAYVAISAWYMRDALVLLRLNPKMPLHAMLTAWGTYYRSSTDYPFLKKQPIAKWIEWWDRLAYGQISYRSLVVPGIVSSQPICLFLWLGLPLLIAYGIRIGMGRGPGRDFAPEQRAGVLFLCGNILYVAVVGNMFENGENNRFRFATDPLSVTLLGLWLQYTVRPALNRWRATRPREPHAHRSRWQPHPD
jgi:hypothetical protein